MISSGAPLSTIVGTTPVAAAIEETEVLLLLETTEESTGVRGDSEEVVEVVEVVEVGEVGKVGEVVNIDVVLCVPPLVVVVETAVEMSVFHSDRLGGT
jgi:hypothetical protein